MRLTSDALRRARAGFETTCETLNVYFLGAKKAHRASTKRARAKRERETEREREREEEEED
jgi:hypothetical protein